MKTYKEFFNNKGGAFADVFFTEFKDLYSRIFGNLPPEFIDNYVNLKYGNKYIADFVSNETYKIILNVFIATHEQSWKRIADLFNAEYDAINPIIEKITKTGDITDTETNNLVKLNAKKAFNENKFIDAERDTDTDTRTKKESYNVTNIKTGVTGGTYHTIISREKDLRKESFANEVIEALVKELTIDIY